MLTSFSLSKSQSNTDDCKRGRAKANTPDRRKDTGVKHDGQEDAEQDENDITPAGSHQLWSRKFVRPPMKFSCLYRV
uniref:hypothetical protein n=1 Tax=Pararhizobium sp. IMCC3301 TaxID=3067904 RepID=UPI0027416A74|nr:hypothetical protein [Pararhizobium sp. IMCC3301]